MEFFADGTVTHSGNGGPDRVTQALMGSVFALLRQKELETKEIQGEEKKGQDKDCRDDTSDKGGTDNPVELALFGQSETGATVDLMDPGSSSASSSSNMFQWMEEQPVRPQNLDHVVLPKKGKKKRTGKTNKNK